MVAFCLAAGSPLFDPLLYLKLRMSNYVDDASPWLNWGGQFITMLRGTGWLALPMMAVGAWFAFSPADKEQPEEIKTMTLLAVGWLFLFAVIRQLRAYWILPALPVFYVVTTFGATMLRSKKVAASAITAILLVLAAQLLLQAREIRSAPYNELRDWVTHNVGSRSFYVLGYDALVLPKNTTCISKMKEVLTRRIEDDRESGLSFTARHVKDWEERSLLMLFDMLGFEYDPGYEFYDYYSAPPELLSRYVPLEDITYVLIQDQFDLNHVPMIRDELGTAYRLVAEKIGAGGGPGGLRYRIYERL